MFSSISYAFLINSAFYSVAGIVLGYLYNKFSPFLRMWMLILVPIVVVFLWIYFSMF